MGNQPICSTDRQLQADLQYEATITRSSAISELHFVADSFQRFGSLIIKQKSSSNTPQFILQHNRSGSREEIIDISEKFYPSRQDLLRERPWTVELESMIKDQNKLYNSVYLGSENGVRRSFIINPFSKFEEPSFKPILYNHYISRLVSAARHRNIHNLVDSFFLASGENRVEGDKVSVVIKEEVSASLSEINFYRKAERWAWTEMQFELLVYHVVNGLDAMHSALISHNDIRPSNIYYSVSKHAYVLGGFTFANKHISPDELSAEVNSVHYYLSPEVRKILGDPPSKRGYNQFKNDIYALGITLLSSFFLVTPSNPEILISSAKIKEKEYPTILRVILSMLLPENDRPTTKDLLNLVRGKNFDSQRNFTREDTLISSLRYRMGEVGDDIGSEKRLISQAYESMFMYDRALKENTELLHYYQVKNDKIQQANLYYKIGQQTLENQEAVESYHQATRLYAEIAKDLLREHRFDQSIYYYNKAIQASKKEGCDDYELAMLLKQLSEAHSEKSEYEISKSFLEEALNLTERSKGPLSLEYADMLADVAKVESEFEEYKAAEHYLKNAIKILEARENEGHPQLNIVKAHVLETLGNNLRLKAKTNGNPEKQNQYRNKAEQCLQQALSINTNQPNNDLKLASNHSNLGHIYFQQRQFERARRSYQTSLLLRRNVSHSTIELGENLTFIANCNKTLKEHDKAIKNYNDALEIFRRQVGNDHNQYTAVALGNLGLVYKEIGKEREAREYIGVAKGILKDLHGESSPDYQYFAKFA